ncbi:hypothetical protein [Citricoccus nitrophenolicus]
MVGPVLAEYGEQSVVESVLAQILREGTGAQHPSARPTRPGTASVTS